MAKRFTDGRHTMLGPTQSNFNYGLQALRACTAAVALLALSACGGGSSGGGSNQAPGPEPLAAGEFSRSIVVDGQSRDYTLVVPEAAQSGERLPLVLLFHGGFGDAADILEVSQLPDQANESGFLIAALEGRNGVFNVGVEGTLAGADDVAFTSAVIDDVAGATPTDTNRAYAAGFSLGGAMTYRLACELSDRIAAVMVVSGFISNEDLDDNTTAFECNPGRAMPILHLHGLADECVRFEGGSGSGFSEEPRLSIPDTIDDWATRNSCSADTEQTLGGAFVFAECNRRLGCADGSEVELCTLDGHGHVWPSGSSYGPAVQSQCLGILSNAIDTNERFWNFVSQFSLNDS